MAYGLKMMKKGIGKDEDFFFHDFKLFDIALLGPNRYSSMANFVYEEEHAPSLNFNLNHLKPITTKAEPGVIDLAEIMSNRSFPQAIDYDGSVTFTVRARLGDLVQVEKEDFVPFIVQEIL